MDHFRVRLPGSTPTLQLAALPPRPICSRARHMPVLAARRSESRQASVAVPPAPAPAPAPRRVVSWAWTSGLLMLAVGAMQVTRYLFADADSPTLAAQQAAAGQGQDRELRLSPGAASAAGAVGPLLLAAETGAAVDETGLLSPEQLAALNTELRLLIQGMEMSLGDLQAGLAEALPPAAAAELEALAAALAAAQEERDAAAQGTPAVAELEEQVADLLWRRFGVVKPHASDPDARTYRSLLFNLTLQRRLLQQVEARETLRREEHAQQQPAAEAGPAAAESSGRPASSGAEAGEAGPLIVAAGAIVPHPKKLETGGEDAFFVSREGLGAMGVADGVGGWAAHGIDPALYPRRLMEACEAGLVGPQGRRDAAEVLQAAHAEAHAPGSATVALGVMAPGRRLHMASLGDCGIRVVRAGAVVFASKTQQHKFNQPLQLASPLHYVSSLPADANSYCISLSPGDVVVMGSDGLFDNVWDEEIASAVAQGVPAPADCTAGGEERLRGIASSLAHSLAETARLHGSDSNFKSPWAVERQLHFVPPLLRALNEPKGGKPDDVTVVVGIVP